jgi:putative ABC transport system ATP-binding protein
MVTHDPVAASYSDLVLFLADGRVVDRLQHPTADTVLARMRSFDGQRSQGPDPDPGPDPGPDPAGVETERRG